MYWNQVSEPPRKPLMSRTESMARFMLRELECLDLVEEFCTNVYIEAEKMTQDNPVKAARVEAAGE